MKNYIPQSQEECISEISLVVSASNQWLCGGSNLNDPIAFLASAHLPVLTSELTSYFSETLIFLTSTGSTGTWRWVPRARRRYRSVRREPSRVPCWGTRLRCWQWCWRSQRKSRWYRVSLCSFYHFYFADPPLGILFQGEILRFYQPYNTSRIHFA